MSLLLNKAMMVAAYEFFAASKPFCDWNLPDAEEVEFVIAKTPSLYGWHQVEVTGRGKTRKLKHYITISIGRNGHTDTFMRTMAHEMVHLVDDQNCLSRNAEHGPAFKKLAREVAKHHGFDPLAM
ncbi:MAG: hypothetical protein E6Q97_28260 [Desulfurellales bacterium]|nr:MAG: hypothetical protein E6Q97_28260 [Desulfurellales bacterium]